MALLALAIGLFFTVDPFATPTAVPSEILSPNQAASTADWPVLTGLTTFDNQVKLLAFTLPSSSFAPGDSVEVTLYWQTQAVTVTYYLFLHLIDANNQLLTQADVPLTNHVCATGSQFSTGMVVTCDSLSLPQGMAAGEYQLLTGVYDPATRRRLNTSEGQNTFFLTTLQLETEAMASAATPSPPCPVTVPNGSTPPGEQPSPDYHGNGQLWTGLWPEGKVIFEPGGPGTIYEDGSLGMKWPWWRGVEGRLTIEGRRLDAPAPLLRHTIPNGYGESGFQATGLIFPTEGCWEVTGKVGQAELTFVTLVVKVGESQ
jgi:hypothetical protein